MEPSHDRELETSLQQSIDRLFQSRARINTYDQSHLVSSVGDTDPLTQAATPCVSAQSSSTEGCDTSPFPRAVRSRIPRVYGEDDAQIASSALLTSSSSIPDIYLPPTAKTKGTLTPFQSRNSVMQQTPNGLNNPLPSPRTSQYERLIHTVPHFHELEDIDLTLPSPGTYRFPNDMDKNGKRVPAKELFARTDILPPANEPLHSQMLCYAQRWACWAATIENPVRRTEVLDWVTKRMEEAWKFGITNGHYPTNADSARKKRTIDTSRHVAPFAWENTGKAPYAIINAELEAAEVSMDTLHDRVESQDLGEAPQLLQQMQNVLDRPLVFSDWTAATPKSFMATVRSRNLFMFALWELQTCQNRIKSLEKQLETAKPGSAQRNFQSRLDMLKLRADQHAALAIELNLKNPINADNDRDEDNDEDGKDEDEDMIHAQPADEADAAMSTEVSTEAFETIAGKLGRASESVSPMAGDDVVDTVNEAKPATELDDSRMSASGELCASIEYNAPASPIDYKVGQKRPFVIEEPVEHQIKKLRTEPDHDVRHGLWPGITQPEQPLRSGLVPDAYDTTPLTPSEPRLTLVESRSVQYDRSPATVQPSTLPLSSSMGPNPVMPDAETKRRILEQVWQPKINTMLQAAGQPMRYITRYSDVRDALTHMGYDLEQRNYFARQFKSDLAKAMTSSLPVSLSSQSPASQAVPSLGRSPMPTQTGITQSQTTDTPTVNPRLILKLPVIPPHGLEEYSQKNVNESGGFSFRCLPFASMDQRRRLDDIAEDYINAIRADKSFRNKKNGRYIVIHDPEDPNRMPIGHGFWDLPKNRRVDGSEWFYEGKSMPEDFEVDAIHIHAQPEAEAPITPTTPKLNFKVAKIGSKAPAGKSNSGSGYTGNNTVDVGRGGNSHATMDQPDDTRLGSGYGIRPRSTAQKRRRVVEDSDEEWTPK